MSCRPESGQGPSLSAFKPDLRFGSNAIRLTFREWIFVATVCLVGFLFAPRLWERIERFEPEADYRIPYELSQDYWLFRRHSRMAGAQRKVLVVGDSVVWGQYVTKDQTLTHYLNEQAGEPRFANLGFDGGHPVALAGLLEHYGQDIAGQRVLLHCNLLWTASKKHDLQTDRAFAFNHPNLAPQFSPRIPCYAEPYTRRVGIAIERGVPFFAWASHIRIASFDQRDLPAWTLSHPYANPVAVMRQGLAPREDRLLHEPVSWTERGIQKQAFEWVGLGTSLQWRFFREAVATLQRRGNQVFVLVGPFNEHMLKEDSLAVYRERKEAVAAWLRDNHIPHLVPPPLPSELYADASHPLAEGYARLAKWLLDEPAFARFNAR